MTTIQLKRGIAADWTSTNPTLAAGEAGFETDTGKLKIGDGTTAWTSLGYRSLAPISISFTDNGSAYYVAETAMIVATAYAGGTGTLAYATAAAADTTTFEAASLPITLAQGDVLRVTVSGISTYKSVTLTRSA